MKKAIYNLPIAFVALIAVGATGCSSRKSSSLEQEIPLKNIVHADGQSVDRTLEDGDVKLLVLSQDLVRKGAQEGRISLAGSARATRFLEARAQFASLDPQPTASPSPVPAPSNSPFPSPSPSASPAPVAGSLILGFPAGLLGEQNVFGGVITSVSDRENGDLGTLKLTDLSPIHVRTLISGASTATPKLVLAGCVSKCTENSEIQGLVAFPIVGVDEGSQSLLVDLSAVGQELDLLSMLDPEGEETGLKAKSSTTVGFDFSLSTLVFDVRTVMVPKDAGSTQPAPETTFNVRWYLKLTSGFNPLFVSRPAVPGVGYFMTERGAEKKIQRFSSTQFGGKPIRYFVKNVPAEHQAAFAAAFDDWNATFKEVLGEELIRYDFVPDGSSLNAELVTGDIRYNILEWDLVNKAGYGGLGPSVAHQNTGEIFSANVLVQGPTVLKLYSDWFKVGAQAAALKAEGRDQEAEQLVLEFRRSVEALMKERTQTRHELKLGRKLKFRVVAQEPSLEDPLMQRNDFDTLPEGYTLETYLSGYFRDMIAHELGHNLGLRHNFRGNLGATDDGSIGSVSRSIMEYLGREFRHLDRISQYDRMAIAYGYKGVAPTHADWFCTDEDAAAPGNADNSAECSRDDATSDPFSFFERRLGRGLDRLVARGSADAPTWTVEDMRREFGIAVNGLMAYALTAEKTASSWSAFFGKAGRPETPASVKGYVLSRLTAQLCDASLAQAVDLKGTEEARAKTLANLDEMRKESVKLISKFKVFAAEELSCLAPPPVLPLL